MANIRESDIFIIQRIYDSGNEEIYRATGADLVQLAQEVYQSDSGSVVARVTTLEGEVIDLRELIEANEELIKDNQDDISLVKENNVQLKQEIDSLTTRINSLETEITLKSKYGYVPGNPGTLTDSKFTSNSPTLVAINNLRFGASDINGLTYTYDLIQIGQTIEMRWDDSAGNTLTYGLFVITANDSTGSGGDFTVRLVAGSGIDLDRTSVVTFRLFPVMEPNTYITGDEVDNLLQPIRDDITTLDGEVVKSVTGGSGISVSRSGSTATVNNTGIRNITAGSGVTVSKSNYVATISVDAAEFKPGDKVVANGPNNVSSGGFYVENGNLHYKA